jgi:hypothetical protein
MADAEQFIVSNSHGEYSPDLRFNLASSILFSHDSQQTCRRHNFGTNPD